MRICDRPNDDFCQACRSDARVRENVARRGLIPEDGSCPRHLPLGYRAIAPRTPAQRNAIEVRRRELCEGCEHGRFWDGAELGQVGPDEVVNACARAADAAGRATPCVYRRLEFCPAGRWTRSQLMGSATPAPAAPSEPNPIESHPMVPSARPSRDPDDVLDRKRKLCDGCDNALYPEDLGIYEPRSQIVACDLQRPSRRPCDIGEAWRRLVCCPADPPRWTEADLRHSETPQSALGANRIRLEASSNPAQAGHTTG